MYHLRHLLVVLPVSVRFQTSSNFTRVVPVHKVMAPTRTFTTETANEYFQDLASSIRVFKICALHPEVCPAAGDARFGRDRGRVGGGRRRSDEG